MKIAKARATGPSSLSTSAQCERLRQERNPDASPFVLPAEAERPTKGMAPWQPGRELKDFLQALELTRLHGLTMLPTFVPFTPWTTLETYLDLLRAATVLQGDYDGDGKVDGADYTVWKEAFGSQGPNLHADGNRNHVVDAADYTIWRDAVSTAGTSSLEKLNVPEPGTMRLLLCSALCLSAGRFLHRRQC